MRPDRYSIQRKIFLALVLCAMLASVSSAVQAQTGLQFNGSSFVCDLRPSHIDTRHV